MSIHASIAWVFFVGSKREGVLCAAPVIKGIIGKAGKQPQALRPKQLPTTVANSHSTIHMRSAASPQGTLPNATRSHTLIHSLAARHTQISNLEHATYGTVRLLPSAVSAGGGGVQIMRVPKTPSPVADVGG